MPESDNDTTLDDDTEADEANQTEDLKELRAAANRTKRAQAEAAEAKRELAMVKAGVDLESKTGQMFAKAYDGEVDVDAIRAEWAEIAPQPPSGQEQVPPSEQGATDERSALASGSPADIQLGADPRIESIESARKVIADGASTDFGLALATSKLIEAGAAGDTRVARPLAGE